MELELSLELEGSSAGAGGAPEPPVLPVTFEGDWDADLGITVADTDKITQWVGQGTATNQTLINNGGANRPTLITSDADFKGHRSVSFNGSNHLYENGNSTPAQIWAVGAKHVFIVCTIETYAMARYIIRDGSAGFGVRSNNAASGMEAFNNDGSTDVTPEIEAPAASTLCLIEVLHNGTTLRLKVDNGAYQDVPSGNTSGFGAFLEVGHASDAAKLTGKIARILSKKTVLIGSDLTQTRAFLAYTYGVTA